MDFGGTVTDVLVPDKDGKVDDVSLGFDTPKGKNTLKMYFKM